MGPLMLVLGLACGPRDPQALKEASTMADPLATRPTVAAPAAFEPPVPAALALSNGVAVWLLEKPELPLVSVRIIFQGGSASDPAAHPGLATLTDEVMMHGAGERDAAAYAAFAEQQAVDVGILTGASSSVLYADSHADKLDTALDLLADAALRPRLTQDDLDRVRDLQLGDIRQDLDDPRAVAPWVTARLYYGEGHPYAHPDVGTPDGLAGLTPADLSASWSGRFSAARAHIVVVGAVEADTLIAALEARFAALPAGTAAPEIPPPAGISDGPRLVLVDNPGATQSALRVVMPGWSAHDPDLAAGDLATTVLGGTFTSRLNRLMREEKGYTYGARASANPGRSFGTVVASSSVEKDSTAEGLTDMLSTLEAAAESGFTDEELVKAQSANRTALISAVGGRARTAGALVRLVRQGHSTDRLITELAAEQAVTAGQLRGAWAPRADLSHALILVVGDLSEIRASVEQAVPGDWEVVDKMPPPRAQ